MNAPPNHVPHTSMATYLIIFVSLLLLTGSTVAVTYLPLGAWHTPLGLAIATTKAVLIVLFFMHGLESGRLVWLTLAGALLTLAIMMTFTFSDYWTRDFDESVRRAVPLEAVKRSYP